MTGSPTQLKNQDSANAKPGEFGTPPTSPAKYTATCLTKRGKLRKVVTVEESNVRAQNARDEGFTQGRKAAFRSTARLYDFFTGVEDLEGVRRLAMKSWDAHLITGFAKALRVLGMPDHLVNAVVASNTLREAEALVQVCLNTLADVRAAADRATADELIKAAKVAMAKCNLPASVAFSAPSSCDAACKGNS